MADALSLGSTFTGRVVSVNPKGLRLDGHDDWLNYSKFAPSIIAPERGDTVSVTVDKAGFVRTIDILSAIYETTNGSHAAPRPSVSRDATITRLAVLKAAAEYAASKPDSKSTDVLKIAASWERWVLRDDAAGIDEDHGLVDAF